MEKRSVEVIVEALNRAGVRYLVVGGLAVVAHGHVRFTADIDLVLDPDEEATRRAIAALAGIGYRPRAPVEFADFSSLEKRREWARDKGLTVFSLFSAQHQATEIDLFLETPFDFDAVYARSRRFEVAPGLSAPFVGLRDLIEMKRRAGRAQDLLDAETLESLEHTSGEERG